MNIFYWVAFLFSMTLIATLLGHPPVLFNAIEKYSSGAITYDEMITLIQQGVLSINTLFGVVIVAGAALVGALNLLALLPFGILWVLMNLITFPSELITSSGLPAEITIPVTAFFTLTQLLVCLSFLRSGAE